MNRHCKNEANVGCTGQVKWNTTSLVKENIFSLGQIAGTVTLDFCYVSAFWDYLWVLFAVPQYHKETNFLFSWVSTSMYHHRIPNYINSTEPKLVFAIFSKEINGRIIRATSELSRVNLKWSAVSGAALSKQWWRRLIHYIFVWTNVDNNIFFTSRHMKVLSKIILNSASPQICRCKPKVQALVLSVL